MNYELIQRAKTWILQMEDEKADFILRLMNNGPDCIQAFLDSGITLLSEANIFLDEWEAQHERA